MMTANHNPFRIFVVENIRVVAYTIAGSRRTDDNAHKLRNKINVVRPGTLKGKGYLKKQQAS